MKILLEQVGGHLVMTAQEKNIINSSPVGEFDASVQDMVDELENRQGVRRMSYNIWHWDLRRKHEAEEYITYFYLKHNNQ